MSKSKHTPGEWKIHDNQIWNDGGTMICIVYGRVAEQRDANAALIASAPSLKTSLEQSQQEVERLREALQLYFTCRDNADGPEHFEHLLDEHKWTSIAKEALKK